jgi:hypothetical protein
MRRVSLNVSPAVKVFAIVALLAAVALGGGMMFLGQPPADADAAPMVLPKKKTGALQAIGAAKQVAAKANAAAAKPAAVAAAGTAKSKPVAAAAAKPQPVAKPKPAPAKAKPKPKPSLIAANGLPTRISRALQSHSVVVVSLWSTGGKIDAMSRDEAAAGAAAAHAGFVPIDLVQDSREAQALTLKLGIVMRSPGILVFTRPDVVSLSLDGFRDRETVAQAATNALR